MSTSMWVETLNPVWVKYHYVAHTITPQTEPFVGLRL